MRIQAWAIKSSLASSSKATACFRFTVGKFSEMMLDGLTAKHTLKLKNTARKLSKP